MLAIICVCVCVWGRGRYGFNVVVLVVVTAIHCFQGSVQFYSKCMADSDKTGEVLAGYKKHAALVEAGEARGSYPVVEVKAKMAAREGIDCSDNGELMGRRSVMVWTTEQPHNKQ